MECTIIKKEDIEEITKPFYKVEINFTGGFYDYYGENEVIIDVDNLDKAKPFLVALETMQHAYPEGRNGCHEHNGVIEYDLFFTDDILSDFEEGCFNEKAYRGFELTEEECKDFDTVEKKFNKYYNKVNPLDILVKIPTDNFGEQYSFNGYCITYVDEKRYEHEVKLTFNEEEKKRFEEMETLLNTKNW